MEADRTARLPEKSSGSGLPVGCHAAPPRVLGHPFTPIACPDARAPGTSRWEVRTHESHGLGSTIAGYFNSIA